MDRAVKPGDDFFDYVNGAWAKRTEIAPDRTFVGIDSVLNDQIERDVRAIVEDMAKNPSTTRPPRPADRRSLRQLDGRGRGREARHRSRSSPISPRSTPRRRPAAISSTCSPSPASIRRSVSPSIPTSRIRPATRPTPPRRASACRTATIICSRAPSTTPIARPTAIISSRSRRLPGSPNPEARADRIIALETQIAKIHWTPEQSRDVEQDLQPDDPGAAARLRAADRMGPRPRQARPRQTSTSSWSAKRARSRARRVYSHRCRCKPGRTGPPSISSAPTRNICPRRSTTPSSTSFPRPCVTFRASAPAGSAASTSSTVRSARASASFTCSGIIRPKATARWAS